MKRLSGALVLALVVGHAHAENLVFQKAREVGFKDCLTALEKTSNFLIKDTSHGAQFKWGTDDPNKTGFSSVVELNFSDGTILASMDVMPTTDGKCYVEYVKVIHFNKPCLAVAKDRANAAYKGELNREVALLSDPPVSDFLMPAGNSCIMMKKEVFTEDRTPK